GGDESGSGGQPTGGSLPESVIQFIEDIINKNPSISTEGKKEEVNKQKDKAGEILKKIEQALRKEEFNDTAEELLEELEKYKTDNSVASQALSQQLEGAIEHLEQLREQEQPQQN